MFFFAIVLGQLDLSLEKRVGDIHTWAQLTKKIASLSAIPIVKNLASLTLIRYFALFC